MKTVTLRRKGPAVRGFDAHAARGWEVADGGTVEVSELAAMELRRDDPAGWEHARAGDAEKQDVIREGV